MNLWTTFTPRKVCWEITYLQTKGKSPNSNWLKNFEIIKDSLSTLKNAGISGIRLVIYPSEITKDGISFDWLPIDKMLDICSSKNIKVDLCIGPFQYPNYPGIYLPDELIKKLTDVNNLDDLPEFYQFGLSFLNKQMEKFGNDERIEGFHFANEWPDKQIVEGARNFRLGVSEKFMIDAAQLIKSKTKKPISLNTNIDVLDKKKIKSTFNSLFKTLSAQIKLGFDIYPSQNIWKKVPLQKFRSLVFPYVYSFKKIQREYPNCEMFFAEVEAQPWGSGQSWYQLISEAKDPHVQILTYSINSLEETFRSYILNTNCKKVSLWGSDFWLIADMMGINWPLDQVKKLKSNF